MHTEAAPALVLAVYGGGFAGVEVNDAECRLHDGVLEERCAKHLWCEMQA